MFLTNDHGYAPFVTITNRFFSSLMTYHWVCNKKKTTDATSGAETTYTSGAHVFIPAI